MLKVVRSGGQTGADIAGVATAKRFGYKTGGTMTKGWKTLNGPRPDYAEKYGMKEHSSTNYPPRTYENVRDSDGTICFAFNFESPRERCTKKAIDQYKKPSIRVSVQDPRPVQEVVDWLIINNIETLNVAGNSEQTYPGMAEFTAKYLAEVFEKLT
jgi:hypothetical protein